MCRLFGLVASKNEDIKFSVLEAKNNFKDQSKNNPHGWGIGYYCGTRPQVVKEGIGAAHSREFYRLSSSVASRIFIAHVRYKSSGMGYLKKEMPIRLSLAGGFLPATERFQVLTALKRSWLARIAMILKVSH